MQLLYPNDPLYCLPIRFGEGASETGARFGGRAPEGITPTSRSEDIRYFATLVLNDAPVIEVSIFVSFDLNQMMKRCGVLTGDDQVNVIIHGASRRASNNVYASELSEHPLVYMNEKDDWMDDGCGDIVIESGHKLG